MKFNILEKLKEIFLKKSEYKTEKTDFNISEESKLEKLNIGTCIMDNEEKEKVKKQYQKWKVVHGFIKNNLN